MSNEAKKPVGVDLSGARIKSKSAKINIASKQLEIAVEPEMFTTCTVDGQEAAMIHFHTNGEQRSSIKFLDFRQDVVVKVSAYVKVKGGLVPPEKAALIRSNIVNDLPAAFAAPASVHHALEYFRDGGKRDVVILKDPETDTEPQDNVSVIRLTTTKKVSDYHIKKSRRSWMLEQQSKKEGDTTHFVIFVLSGPLAPVGILYSTTNADKNVQAEIRYQMGENRVVFRQTLKILSTDILEDCRPTTTEPSMIECPKCSEDIPYTKGMKITCPCGYNKTASKETKKVLEST